MPLFFVGFKGTKERTSELDDIKPPSLKHNLSLLFKNKPLMLIVISGILGAARMVFTYTGGWSPSPSSPADSSPRSWCLISPRR